MTYGLHHVSVFVTDMQRALYLFRDVLGFTAQWHVPLAGGKKLSALLGLPGMQAELIYLRSPDGEFDLELSRLIQPFMNVPSARLGGPGSVSLSLTVNDLDLLHERITAEGWEPLSSCLEMRSPEGILVRAFCFSTEDGLTLELVEKAGVAVQQGVKK